MSIFSKMTAIADEIRAKTGKSGKLTLDDMASEIASIETGIDTSDATAVAGDILSGKTAYVNGEKITGSYEGAELNFEVVSNPKPNTANENTIWVNADYITGWYFTFEQPENMADGEVWFCIDTTSNAKFNALKKNNITICPRYAKQMVSGALVDVVAESYLGGEWQAWLPPLYLYKAGDECTDITGSFTSRNKAPASGVSAWAPQITRNSTNMYMVQNHSGCGGIVYANKAIDVTGYKELVFDGKLYSSKEAENCRVVIWSSLGTYGKDNIVAELQADNADGVRSIPLPTNGGSYVIGFYLYTPGSGADSTVTLNNLYLK